MTDAHKAVYPWQHTRVCQWHSSKQVSCDCETEIKHDLWMMYDDQRREVACIQCFGDPDEGPFYGTWTGGRTGPMLTFTGCAARLLEKIAG